MFSFCILLYAIGLQAEEYYFDITDYAIDDATESKQACRAMQKGIDHTVCFSKRVHYVTMRDDQACPGLNVHVRDLKKAYDAIQPADYLTPEYPPATKMYANYDIKLIAVTPYIYTIQEDIATYIGGAHGSFETHYHNYTKEGKPLVLDTMIRQGKQKAFIDIAKQA